MHVVAGDWLAGYLFFHFLGTVSFKNILKMRFSLFLASKRHFKNGISIEIFDVDFFWAF